MADKILMETATAIGKDILAIVRDITLGAIVVMLIFWPSTVHDILRKAGVSKILGIEIEKAFVDNANALSALEAQASALKLELVAARGILRDLLSKGAVQTVLDDARKGIERIEARLGQATAAIESAEETQKTNQPIVDQAEKSLTLDGFTWAIVFGGHKASSDAEAEIDKAKRLGFANAAIYARAGVYRSVVAFESRADAEKALPKIRGLNPGAYIVVLTAWCRKPFSQGPYLGCN